jgi:hypothetical protein
VSVSLTMFVGRLCDGSKTLSGVKLKGHLIFVGFLLISATVFVMRMSVCVGKSYNSGEVFIKSGVRWEQRVKCSMIQGGNNVVKKTGYCEKRPLRRKIRVFRKGVAQKLVKFQ